MSVCVHIILEFQTTPPYNRSASHPKIQIWISKPITCVAECIVFAGLLNFLNKPLFYAGWSTTNFYGKKTDNETDNDES